MFNTRCTTCTPGTFSDQVSAEQVCTPCTDCRAQRRTTVEDCTPTQDAVCGATVITQTQAGDVEDTSAPKEDPPNLPTEEPDKENPTVTTAATGATSPLEFLRPTQIAMIVGPVGVLALIVAAAVPIFCVCRRRRRKAANDRPDPEGGSQQLEQLMSAPSDAEEEEENEEEEDERGDGEDGETLPKPAVAEETNDGLEEIPDGAEGATSVKDARAPTQDTDDPTRNERDLHTKDVTYGLEELTSDGDITVMTSRIGEEEEEDLYKETSV
ncbi:Hypp5791 [Branchiostoma lanceolatum]|uniref:Hypp5791 protein n=1 Tax=Branchiostoma lanceolatum TaxID=7740 RepID=A0A8J9YNX3_BRALA|nr:Hypp5791 [Branchiostoma lanceolatum]